MKDKNQVVIVGTGSFGREIFSWIKSGSQGVDVKGFLSSNKADLDAFPNLPPILGDEKDYQFEPSDRFIVAIGDVGLKKKIVSILKERGAQFFSYIHPTSYVVDSSIIGEGVIIGPLCCISNCAVIGNFVTINAACVIGHDVEISEFSILSPQCGLMGYAKLGKNVFFGAHTIVAPKIQVGQNSVISANTTLLRDVPDNSFVAGVLPKIIPRL